MPFWRQQGLNGFVLSLDDEFRVVLDNSPPESSCGVLVGFLEAAQARTAAEMTGGERRKLITSTLVIYFGARAAEQFGIVERGLNGRGVHPLLLRGHVGDGRVDRCGKRDAHADERTDKRGRRIVPAARLRSRRSIVICGLHRSSNTPIIA